MNVALVVSWQKVFVVALLMEFSSSSHDTSSLSIGDMPVPETYLFIWVNSYLVIISK
jgi:hypothetical protein